MATATCWRAFGCRNRQMSIRRNMQSVTFHRCAVTVSMSLVLLLACQQVAVAKWEKGAFQAQSVAQVLTALYGSKKLHASPNIQVMVPAIAENAAVVAVTLVIDLGQFESVTLLADGNRYPLVSYQELTGKGRTELQMRIKLFRSSTLMAVVQAHGMLYFSTQSVKTTIGGCGSEFNSYTRPENTRPVTPYNNVTDQDVEHIPWDITGGAREKYQSIVTNGVISTATRPISTFSVDVDTGSYSNVRRFIYAGRTPPRDAVRVEEFINNFIYDYAEPRDRQVPFLATMEMAGSPWDKGKYLLQIGIKGYTVAVDALPPMNLVFLIDVSGSMQQSNKLQLLKASLALLVAKLRKKDSVAIVVYAGTAGMVLPPTAGDRKDEIRAALDRLSAGGSTNGGQGIALAYRLARESYVKGGINRVVLGTDGDFNVGITGFSQLIRLVERQRESGVFLTTLGFGEGNYNEQLMEQLADKGNGQYAYIDSLQEAQKVLLHGMASTLNVIAKDVKVQVEFNPALVADYRLIGYENRVLRKQDFANDRVDAGEIGAGHSVTAMYELTLRDGKRHSGDFVTAVSPQPAGEEMHDHIGQLRIRFKLPGGETAEEKSRLLKWELSKKNIVTELDATSENFRFAAAVAAFGQRLRHDVHVNGLSLDTIIALADAARGADRLGYRRDFVRLLQIYAALQQ